MLAQCRSAPLRLAPLRSALYRLALRRLASLRLAPLRSALYRSTSLRLAINRSAPLRLAPLRSAPLRLAPLRSAPLRSAPLRSAFSSMAFHRLVPCNFLLLRLTLLRLPSPRRALLTSALVKGLSSLPVSVHTSMFMYSFSFMFTPLAYKLEMSQQGNALAIYPTFLEQKLLKGLMQCTSLTNHCYNTPVLAFKAASICGSKGTNCLLRATSPSTNTVCPSFSSGRPRAAATACSPP